jgi:hypothetical protein
LGVLDIDTYAKAFEGDEWILPKQCQLRKNVHEARRIFCPRRGPLSRDSQFPNLRRCPELLAVGEALASPLLEDFALNITELFNR